MSDNAKVYKKLHDALHGKKRCAIATIVNVNGSAYRKEGAKMYIDEDEKTVGMISGGCLEADVIEIAKKVMTTNQPLLKKYNLDEDFMWGLGLGCPGEVEIYIESFNQSILEVGEYQIGK